MPEEDALRGLVEAVDKADLKGFCRAYAAAIGDAKSANSTRFAAVFDVDFDDLNTAAGHAAMYWVHRAMRIVLGGRRDCVLLPATAATDSDSGNSDRGNRCIGVVVVGGGGGVSEDETRCALLLCDLYVAYDHLLATRGHPDAARCVLDLLEAEIYPYIADQTGPYPPELFMQCTHLGYLPPPSFGDPQVCRMYVNDAIAGVLKDTTADYHYTAGVVVDLNGNILAGPAARCCTHPHLDEQLLVVKLCASFVATFGIVNKDLDRVCGDGRRSESHNNRGGRNHENRNNHSNRNNRNNRNNHSNHSNRNNHSNRREAAAASAASAAAEYLQQDAMSLYGMEYGSAKNNKAQKKAQKEAQKEAQNAKKAQKAEMADKDRQDWENAAEMAAKARKAAEAAKAAKARKAA